MPDLCKCVRARGAEKGGGGGGEQEGKKQNEEETGGASGSYLYTSDADPTTRRSAEKGA